jgi:hypothetical protein
MFKSRGFHLEKKEKKKKKKKNSPLTVYNDAGDILNWSISQLRLKHTPSITL